jgi:hypothetical protein
MIERAAVAERRRRLHSIITRPKDSSDVRRAAASGEALSSFPEQTTIYRWKDPALEPLPGRGAARLRLAPNLEVAQASSHEWAVSARGFNNTLANKLLVMVDYDDVRSTELVAPPQPFPVRIANGLRGETYGAELVADYLVTDWWRLRPGYTELQVHLRPGPGTRDVTNGSGEFRDPNRYLSLWSLWDLPAHIEFDSGFRYVAAIANQDVPAYVELDARLAWHPRPDLELAIAGQNLLHAHHAEFGLPASRFEISRVIYGKVTWRF